MCEEAAAELLNDGFSDEYITRTPYLNLRFKGSNNNIFIGGPTSSSIRKGMECKEKELEEIHAYYRNSFIGKYEKVCILHLSFLCPSPN